MVRVFLCSFGDSENPVIMLLKHPSPYGAHAIIAAGNHVDRITVYSAFYP